MSENLVIKKITVVDGGAHGGAWKVAFADFMTGMMAFFLVMWLVSQNEETKKSVAEYFSTPSVIEYNFSNYGVELTLEKLFLDLINEPLKVFADFVTPVDITPNLMQMGHKKIVMQHLLDQLEDIATNVQVDHDSIEFEIVDHYLFEAGTATPAPEFVSIMEKIKGITTGLEDSKVSVYSSLFYESVPGGDKLKTKHVAQARADLLKQNIRSSLEHETVDVHGHFITGKARVMPPRGRPPGKLKFVIKQNAFTSTGERTRSIDSAEPGKYEYESAEESNAVYDHFVEELTRERKKKNR